jgi:hypothetical protein
VEESDTFFDSTTVTNEVTPEMPNIDLIIDDCILHRNIRLYKAHAREVNTKEPDYGALRPFFGWLPTDVIKRTFAATTQHARSDPDEEYNPQEALQVSFSSHECPPS